MARLDTALLELGALDELAASDTPIHRLDPRVKVVTTLAFIGTVVSFGRYELSALLPFVLYPVALVALAGLPVRTLVKRLLPVLPFVLMIGVFNPLLDRAPLVQLGPLSVSGGWVSFISIFVRCVLTVTAALILVATTGFQAVCLALQRLGVPRVFVTQLLFLYRYIFVLIEEAARMMRAYALRAVGRRRPTIRIAGSLMGQLLLRALGRAERVSVAMHCRGFDGRIRLLYSTRIGLAGMSYALGWGSFFVLARLCNLSRWLGVAVLEVIR
jgi:cobalt/nickel transport system permease protein